MGDIDHITNSNDLEAAFMGKNGEGKWATDLKGEGFVKDWAQVLALDLSFKLLFLVRKHVDFDIGV